MEKKWRECKYYLRSCKKIYNLGGYRKEKGCEWRRSQKSRQGQQGSESISCFNRQINKERYHLFSFLSPWKPDVPKFMSISRCEYSVVCRKDITQCNIERCFSQFSHIHIRVEKILYMWFFAIGFGNVETVFFFSRKMIKGRWFFPVNYLM